MNYLFFLTLALLQGCAYVHHTQVGDVLSSPGHVPIPFEILISETGVNVQEIGAISNAAIADNNAANNLGAAALIISLFQMGPRTGNAVWTGDEYADKTYMALYEKCPSGQITGLHSTRETSKYPVVSGEIIKIKGYCLEKKTKVIRKNI